MKRWPRVVLPEAMPSTVPGTMDWPCSITRPWTGRTNSASPSPQRIILATGNFFSAASTLPASVADRALPVAVLRQANTRPFGVSICSKSSTAIPFFLAKPASAGVGLPSLSRPTLTEGPCISSALSGDCARTCVACTASRRGVAKTHDWLPAARKPSCARSSVSVLRNASPNRASDFGGSSSVSSSTSSVAVVMMRAPSESRASRVIRNRPVRRRATACARGRCRPHVR